MNPVVDILRQESTAEHGTFGSIRINTGLFCWTLEPYEYGNTPNESCIPAVMYRCERVSSNLVRRLTHGLITETFEITHVPDRTYVRFHGGNTDEDTLACPLLGETLGKLHGDRAILNSGKTFKSFMAIMEPYDWFTLVIRRDY